MSGSSQIPQAYTPTGQAGADQQFQGLTQSGYGQAQALPGQVGAPSYAAAQNIGNNPYTAWQQGGANQTAGIGATQIAPQAYAGSAALQGYGNQGMGSNYGAQILQQGFDPQQALYNQQFQQNQDQTNAVSAMYGLGSSPYGAGLANQSNQNFNLNWQNQQLGRENQAITGYNNLGSGIAGAYGNAANLGSTGQQIGMNSANLPYQTYMGNQQNTLAGYGQYGSNVNQAFGPFQSMIGDLSTYLGLGQGATGLNQQAQIAQNQQNSQALGGLGSLFGSLGSIGAYGLGG